MRDLATRLRTEAEIDVVLDQWEVLLGDQVPAFMERAVRDNDFVLIVCTPRYRQKSNDRSGGVGYEGDIMTAEVFNGTTRRKFIPLIRAGTPIEARPTWLSGSAYIDFRGDQYLEASFDELVRTLRRERRGAPPLGRRPV